ncbi:hypothetical protein OAH18_03765, partial [bacterium]|nr:hypothetical protein [bacterium]
AIISLSDMMATFAELTQLTLGDSEGPDSVSFASLLSQPSGVSPRKSLVMQSVGPFAIREENWKLCLCPGSGCPAGSQNAAGNDPMPNVAWKKALADFDGTLTNKDLVQPRFVQLFDLANDPHEDTNLAKQLPERVDRMVKLLQTHVANGRSTAGPSLNNDKNVRIVSLDDRRLPAVVRERAK